VICLLRRYLRLCHPHDFLSGRSQYTRAILHPTQPSAFEPDTAFPGLSTRNSACHKLSQPSCLPLPLPLPPPCALPFPLFAVPVLAGEVDVAAVAVGFEGETVLLGDCCCALGSTATRCRCSERIDLDGDWDLDLDLESAFGSCGGSCCEEIGGLAGEAVREVEIAREVVVVFEKEGLRICG